MKIVLVSVSANNTFTAISELWCIFNDSIDIDVTNLEKFKCRLNENSRFYRTGYESYFRLV